jgi:hypothetical protein
MDAMPVLSTSVALGAVALAQVFLFATEARRTATVVVPASVLAAVGATGTSLQANPEWLAVLVALSAATLLAEGRYVQVFGVAACLSLVPAAIAGASLLEVAWVSVSLSRAALAGAVVLGAASGYVLRSFRREAAFSDAALLLLLCALALMSAPTALLGWQRAAIAAEGDESTFVAPSLEWLLPVGIAFIGGFAWRLWRINRTQERKKT